MSAKALISLRVEQSDLYQWNQAAAAKKQVRSEWIRQTLNAATKTQTSPQ